MRNFINYIWAIPIIFFGLCSCSPKSGKQTETNSLSEINLNQIKLKDLNGKSIDLDQYQGKTLFINLWATWCKPCLEEMPSIERAQAILKDKNIEFLFASNEEAGRIQNFRSKKNLNLNFMQLENQEELNIQALPTTFIFNAQGKLVFHEMGYRQWDGSDNIEMINNIINTHD